MEEKEQIKAKIVEVMGDEFTLGVACRVVGIRRDTAVAWQEQDPEFKAVCDSQMETYLDRIENKMGQRALDMKQPHDATQGMFILNGYRRERFMPMTRHELTGPGGGPVQIALLAKIKKMTDDELRAELAKLLGPTLIEVPAPKPEQDARS